MWVALSLLVLLLAVGVAGATGVGAADTRDTGWSMRLPVTPAPVDPPGCVPVEPSGEDADGPAAHP
jgi:hypothetical protein